MIFVTVGTHEQQFNRLVECVDRLKGEGVINEDVLIQTGYSDYKPKHCEWCQWIPFDGMVENVEKARIVITHGGPSSFILPLRVGKIPIVVPRRSEFHEHVNDHQINFCKACAERYQSILLVEDINELGKVIAEYDEMKRDGQMDSNNANFCAKLEIMVREMMER